MALSYHHDLSFANIEQEELNLLVLEDHQKKTQKLSTSLGCALMLQYLRKYKEKLKPQ
jgi:hypothetical protein